MTPKMGEVKAFQKPLNFNWRKSNELFIKSKEQVTSE